MKKPKAHDPTVYDRVHVILSSAQTHAARSVNTAQVVANWLIGREIVEEQQQGAKRAGYAENVIPDLAALLKKKGRKGYGEVTLYLCRQFYSSYPELPGAPILYALRKESEPGKNPSISYAVRNQFADALILIPQVIEATRSSEWQPGLLHHSLSWTHYRALMRVSSQHARAFYEIEATQQNWNASETDRQIQSLLFERLAKSRDKKGVMALATKGQVVQTPADVFKDPVVIEFLGLPEVNYYDRERRTEGDNPTLGLILCTDQNETAVKYTLGTGQQKIFASRYQFHLPTEADLAAEIRRELEEFQPTTTRKSKSKSKSKKKQSDA